MDAFGPFRSPRPLPAAAALPLQCRSASSAGSAASSREPVQLRCRGSWSEGSGCAAERVRDRPAWWPGRRRRPSGNARPAAARRSCVGGVPGQPVPTAGLSESEGVATPGALAGAACCRFASGLRAAARFASSALMPLTPRGAASSGAPCRGDAATGLHQLWQGAPRGLRSDAAPDKGPLTLPRRSGRAPPRNGAAVGRTTATRPAQGPRDTRSCRCCCRCYLPPPRSGGVQGGRSILPCAWAGETKREGVPTGHSLLCLIKGRPVDGRSGLGLSPAPAWQSLIYRTEHKRGETIQGFHPCTPSSHHDMWV